MCWTVHRLYYIYKLRIQTVGWVSYNCNRFNWKKLKRCKKRDIERGDGREREERVSNNRKSFSHSLFPISLLPNTPLTRLLVMRQYFIWENYHVQRDINLIRFRNWRIKSLICGILLLAGPWFFLAWDSLNFLLSLWMILDECGRLVIVIWIQVFRVYLLRSSILILFWQTNQCSMLG